MDSDQAASRTDQASPDRAALEVVIESARRLGVGIDAEEAARWVAAIGVEAAGGEVVVDVNSGVYGHRVSMLDFTPRDLARFREIGEIVGFPDRPPTVLTALALSGSAAQGKIQSYPGVCGKGTTERCRLPSGSEHDLRD